MSNRTPAHRVEYVAYINDEQRARGVTSSYMSPMIWRNKDQGRPTAANLAKDVAHFEAATRDGGCLAHLGETKIAEARIVRQATREVVAEYTA